MCSSRLASYYLIFKLILLDNEEERFCTKTELLSFKIILQLAKQDMCSSRLVSYDLIFKLKLLDNEEELFLL